MQNSPNLDKPSPPISFVLHPNFESVRFWDKLKALRNGPFKIVNKRSDVTCQRLAKEAKTFHTRRHFLILHYRKVLLLFPHILSKNE